MAKKVQFKFDPFKLAGESKRGMSQRAKDRVFKEVAEMLLEETKLMMLNSTSPVAGEGRFKKLSKDYASKMKGGNRNSDLLLNGDLQDAMRVKREGDTLIHTVLSKEQPKAENHNRGVTLPRRPFIPEGKGATYKQQIIDEMKRIIRDEKGE